MKVYLYPTILIKVNKMHSQGKKAVNMTMKIVYIPSEEFTFKYTYIHMFGCRSLPQMHNFALKLHFCAFYAAKSFCLLCHWKELDLMNHIFIKFWKSVEIWTHRWPLMVNLNEALTYKCGFWLSPNSFRANNADD